VFLAGILKPFWFFIGVVILRLYTLWSEKVGAFPATGLTETGIGLFHAIMERGAADATGRFRLAERPVHGIEQAEGFCGSVMEVFAVGLK